VISIIDADAIELDPAVAVSVASMATRSTPTVIVSRTPAAGREREFERWLRRLSAAARRSPGHVHSDIQAPTAAHPEEWVIVYQFADGDRLRGWLASREREELIEEGADLVVGPAREQTVALSGESDWVTAVASFRVLPALEDRYVEYQQQLVERMSAASGFIRSELFEPVPGVQDETVVVFSFDTREHLDAWLRSDDRLRMLAEMDEFIEGDRTLNVVGGFGGWFGRPGMAEVRRWKQAAVVLLALFPTTLLLTVLRRWLLPDIGVVLGVLIGNVLGVAILSWVLMPVLTRWLDGWLRR
jgi:antibiotic biosynthesis monooxygenase (ABM) superfamily enzyme